MHHHSVEKRINSLVLVLITQDGKELAGLGSPAFFISLGEGRLIRRKMKRGRGAFRYAGGRRLTTSISARGLMGSIPPWGAGCSPPFRPMLPPIPLRKAHCRLSFLYIAAFPLHGRNCRHVATRPLFRSISVVKEPCSST